MNPEIALNYLIRIDPVLATLIEQFEPFPFNRKSSQDTTLSALSKAIFYQSISLQSANAVYSRFVQLYPQSSFPSATEILNTSNDRLRTIGLPISKIKYLKGVAENTLNGLPSLEELEELDNESIIKLLTQLKGIGRWSVQMVLIFQLRRLDVLPVDDIGIRNAIRDLYQLEHPPDRATVEAFGQKWSPYRTIATWYLWLSRGPTARALLNAWTAN